MSYRLAAAAFGLVSAVTIVLAGCSAGSGSSAGTTANGATATSGNPAATAAATVVPTSQPEARAPRASANGVTVSLTGLSDRPALTPGGSPLEFTVNIRNSSKRKYRDITPVVAIEHCTCVSTALQRAPAGRLQEYSMVTGKWRAVYYDTIGTGKDYLNVVEQSPLTINPGATVSFTFRVAFDAAARQAHAVHAGQTGLLVSVVQRSSGSRTLATVKVRVSVTAP